MSINKNKSPIVRSFPDEPEPTDNSSQQQAPKDVRSHYYCSMCFVTASWRQYLRHLKSWQHLNKKRQRGFETDCENNGKRKAEYELEDCMRKVRRKCDKKHMTTNSPSTFVD